MKAPKAVDGKYKIMGSWMYLDDMDAMHLSEYGFYELPITELFQKIVKPGFVVVDAGAHIGYYTLLMARVAKHVYSFEPSPANYQLLQKNVAVNNYQNVTLINKALADRAGHVTLHLCHDNSGMNRIYPSKWCSDKVEVEMTRLDDVVEHADFIKMDIEGAEYGALKGMTRLLEQGTTLMMEFHPPSIIEYGAKPHDVYDFIRSFGYRIMLPDGKEISYEELEPLATDQIDKNILCVRK